jgi:hypothetical protein
MAGMVMTKSDQGATRTMSRTMTNTEGNNAHVIAHDDAHEGESCPSGENVEYFKESIEE